MRELLLLKPGSVAWLIAVQFQQLSLTFRPTATEGWQNAQYRQKGSDFNTFKKISQVFVLETCPHSHLDGWNGCWKRKSWLGIAFAVTASHYQLHVPALTTGAVIGTIPLLVVAGYILAPFPSSHPQEWVYPLRGGKCNLFLLLQLHTFRLLQDFQRLKEKIVKNNKKINFWLSLLERSDSTILLW